MIEGVPGVIDEGLGQIREALARYIEDESESASPATGEFPDMTIRR